MRSQSQLEQNYILCKPLTAVVLKEKQDPCLRIWYAIDRYNRLNGGQGTYRKEELIKWLSTSLGRSAGSIRDILAKGEGVYWNTDSAWWCDHRVLRTVGMKRLLDHFHIEKLSSTDLVTRDIAELATDYGTLRRLWYQAVEHKPLMTTERLRIRRIAVDHASLKPPTPDIPLPGLAESIREQQQGYTIGFEKESPQERVLRPVSRAVQAERYGRSTRTIRRWHFDTPQSTGLATVRNYSIYRDGYKTRKDAVEALRSYPEYMDNGKTEAPFRGRFRVIYDTACGWCIAAMGPNTYIDLTPVSAETAQYLRNIRRRISKPRRLNNGCDNGRGERVSAYVVRKADLDNPDAVFVPVVPEDGTTNIYRTPGGYRRALWVTAQGREETAYALCLS